MEPIYGQSPHYQGDKGETYFAWQNRHMDIGARIEARKFCRFVRDQDCVLDFGCGGGSTLKNILCKRRIGVEINPAARRTAIENGLECFTDLAEVPSSVADVVISNHALEHVSSPMQVLHELRRTLKPQGVLALVLPIDDWRTQLTFNPSDINHHLYTWSPQLIGNCLVDAGFDTRTLQIRVYPHAWFPGYRRAYPILPAVMFDFLCLLYSVLRRRRQIMAVAEVSHSTQFTVPLRGR